MISTRAYVTIRIALAKQVLEHPKDPRYRQAYDEIKEAFLGHHIGAQVLDAAELPKEPCALLRPQAG